MQFIALQIFVLKNKSHFVINLYPWIYMQWIGLNLAEKSRNQVIHTVVFLVFDTGGSKI